MEPREEVGNAQSRMETMERSDPSSDHELMEMEKAHSWMEQLGNNWARKGCMEWMDWLEYNWVQKGHWMELSSCMLVTANGIELVVRSCLGIGGEKVDRQWGNESGYEGKQ